MTLVARALHVLVLVGLLGITGSAAAEPDQDKKARAFQTFERGEAQFKQGSYDAAAQLFESAWQAWHDPAYLFNIGLAFEKAERWPLAVQWYGTFIATYPDVPNISEVRRRYEAARQSREASRAEVVVTTEPAGARAEVPTDASVTACVTPCSLRVDAGPVTVRATLGERTREAARSLGPGERWDVTLRMLVEGGTDGAGIDRTAPITSFVIGGVALVSGVVFGVMANESYTTGSDLAKQDGGVLSGDDYDRLTGLRSDLERDSLIADISFGTALVAGTIGLVLWLVDDEPSEVTLHAPTRGAASGSAAWHF